MSKSEDALIHLKSILELLRMKIAHLGQPFSKNNNLENNNNNKKKGHDCQHRSTT